MSKKVHQHIKILANSDCRYLIYSIHGHIGFVVRQFCIQDDLTPHHLEFREVSTFHMSNIEKSPKGPSVCDSSTSTTDRSDTDLTLEQTERASN